MFHVFAALAEFERDLIRERTSAGLAAARARAATAADHGPLSAEQLAAQLSSQGRTASRATIDRALAELADAGAAAIDPQTRRWMLRPAAQHPLLVAVDLHGAHDFRHTFSTWLRTPASRLGSSTS